MLLGRQLASGCTSLAAGLDKGISRHCTQLFVNRKTIGQPREGGCGSIPRPHPAKGNLGLGVAARTKQLLEKGLPPLELS